MHAALLTFGGKLIMMGKPDPFEAAVKAILSAVLEYQMGNKEDEADIMEDLMEGEKPEGMGVTVEGETPDDLKAGLDEADSLLEDLDINELLGKKEEEDEEE